MRDIFADITRGGITSAGGAVLSAINQTYALIKREGVVGASRALAAAIVSHERNAAIAARELQRELAGQGGNAQIPVAPQLGPGEVRVLGVIEVDLPGDRYTGPVFLSARFQGIPSADQLAAALGEVLAEFADEYEVDNVTRYLTGNLELLRVEGGG